MQTIHYVKPHLLAKLHDELLAAGVHVYQMSDDYTDAGAPIKDGIRLTVSVDADKSAADSVVAAHSATADQAALDQQTAAEATLRQNMWDAIPTLETADQNWSTLSATQKDAATQLAVRGVAKLARLYLRRITG